MFLEVTDATFDVTVLESDVAVLAHFTAPGCRPCKAIEPHLVELAETHAARVRLVRIDIDANLGTPARFGILSIPTVIVFADGEARATLVGAQKPAKYAAALEPHL